MPRFRIFISAVLVSGGLISCTKAASLVPLTNLSLSSVATNQIQVNFCTPPSAVQKQYLKTLIILDHSGSNAKNYKMTTDGSGAPDVSSGTIVVSNSYATDPKGLTRYGSPTTSGTLLNYLANLPANTPGDPTRFFALIDFNSNAISYPANSVGFTSKISDFYNYVFTDAGAATGGAPNDNGGTSYKSALTAASNIINSDIKTATTCAALSPAVAPSDACPQPGVAISSSYVIIFMSDGSPITDVSGIATDSNTGAISITGPVVLTKESTAEILANVGTLINLQQAYDKYVTSVNLHSIYYYVPGNVDASGQTLLSQMAKAGNGQSFNALSGSNINYAQFQPPQKTIQYQLADVFVTNANAVWWSDGKYHLDSDGDGLPDDIEKAWGTDPTKNSTANNGVSDLVRYRLANGAACVSKNPTTGFCDDAVTNYANGACSSIPSSVIGGKLKFLSSDPNGLNDCEKLLLGDAGGIGTPDSNLDNIPDFLEFLNNVPFQKGTAPAITTVNQDGFTTYQKIKYSLPVSTPNNSISGLIPTSYQLNQISSSALQTCYNLNASNFPVIGSGNKVRVDILMKSNLVQDSYSYKIGYKTFPASNSLIFNDWTNAAEIANGTWSSWP